MCQMGPTPDPCREAAWNFEQWWDTGKSTATPETYRGWEESCRQAFEAGAKKHCDICALEIERMRGEVEGSDVLVAARDEMLDQLATAAVNYLRIADEIIKDRLRDDPEYDAACLSLLDAPMIRGRMHKPSNLNYTTPPVV